MFETGRVLLIADSPDEAALVIAMLDEGALSCEWAPTLGEGCTVLRDRPPSCVLVDLGRPDADGLASLDEVVRVAPEIPVIVLTGPDNAATGGVAVRHGAQDHLDKGWMDQRLLARSVRYAIERRAADRALGETSTRLSTALEAMLDGFGVFSAVREADGELVDFTWDYVNAAGVATYGRAPGDLLGRRMCEVAPGIRESGL
ncbi:MAG: response regulator, partial [Candidatus Limnocylindrales bacterium]